MKEPYKRWAVPALALALVACGAAPVRPGDEVDAADVRPAASLYQAPDLRGAAWDDLLARNDASAFNEMGRRYGLGLNVTKDAVRAKVAYQQAADLGLAMGQCNLGFMHLSGEGTRKDPAEAVRWYRLCAAQGHFVGARTLGTLYAQGQAGLPRDGRRAEAWFLLAARQGHVPAQEALVAIYTRGLPGLAPDASKATVWRHRVRNALLFNNTWKDLPSGMDRS